MSEDTLSKFTDSKQKLVDVIGYFEDFKEGNTKCSLCAIGFIFEKDSFYVVAREDDSFALQYGDWRHSPELIPISLVDKQPWSLAIGCPLLWSWMLYNQQGYFDGIQIEFAKNAESKSVVIQLVALGSEVKQREVAGKCSTITCKQ